MCVSPHYLGNYAHILCDSAIMPISVRLGHGPITQRTNWILITSCDRSVELKNIINAICAYIFTTMLLYYHQVKSFTAEEACTMNTALRRRVGWGLLNIYKAAFTDSIHYVFIIMSYEDTLDCTVDQAPMRHTGTQIRTQLQALMHAVMHASPWPGASERLCGSATCGNQGLVCVCP